MQPETKTEFQNNPQPLPEMNNINWEYDEYGNLKYELLNNQIVFSPQTPTAENIANDMFNKTKMIAIVKALASGIVNGVNDPQFKKLTNILKDISNNII